MRHAMRRRYFTEILIESDYELRHLLVTLVWHNKE
jgi:hypothetical protein